MITPDFTNFWTQSLQQSFNPKVAIGHKGLIFPEAVTALGALGYNLCTAGTWNPRSVWKDSMTGMSCQELADEYEAFSGAQWTDAQLILVQFEWAADLFKRVTDVDDKQGIVTAIKGTKLVSSFGTIDFTAAVAENTKHPHPNVCVPPHAAGQWVKATSGKWKVDKTVAFTTDPAEVAIEATVQPIVYS
jgi:branched-chain amino acid transport system substrate-binding protein